MDAEGWMEGQSGSRRELLPSMTCWPARPPSPSVFAQRKNHQVFGGAGRDPRAGAVGGERPLGVRVRAGAWCPFPACLPACALCALTCRTGTQHTRLMLRSHLPSLACAALTCLTCLACLQPRPPAAPPNPPTPLPWRRLHRPPALAPYTLGKTVPEYMNTHTHTRTHAHAQTQTETHTSTYVYVRASRLSLLQAAAQAEATMLKRLGRPHEQAAVVAFLASDDASYVTGETVVVAGGMQSRL